MGKTIRPRTRAAVCGKTCHCKGETCVNMTPGTVQFVTFNNGVQKGGEGAMDPGILIWGVSNQRWESDGDFKIYL